MTMNDVETMVGQLTPEQREALLVLLEQEEKARTAAERERLQKQGKLKAARARLQKRSDALIEEMAQLDKEITALD